MKTEYIYLDEKKTYTSMYKYCIYSLYSDRHVLANRDTRILPQNVASDRGQHRLLITQQFNTHQYGINWICLNCVVRIVTVNTVVHLSQQIYADADYHGCVQKCKLLACVLPSPPAPVGACH